MQYSVKIDSLHIIPENLNITMQKLNISNLLKPISNLPSSTYTGQIILKNESIIKNQLCYCLEPCYINLNFQIQHQFGIINPNSDQQIKILFSSEIETNEDYLKNILQQGTLLLKVVESGSATLPFDQINNPQDFQTIWQNQLYGAKEQYNIILKLDSLDNFHSVSSGNNQQQQNNKQQFKSMTQTSQINKTLQQPSYSQHIFNSNSNQNSAPHSTNENIQNNNTFNNKNNHVNNFKSFQQINNQNSDKQKGMKLTSEPNSGSKQQKMISNFKNISISGNNNIQNENNFLNPVIQNHVQQSQTGKKLSESFINNQADQFFISNSDIRQKYEDLLIKIDEQEKQLNQLSNICEKLEIEKKKILDANKGINKQKKQQNDQIMGLTIFQTLLIAFLSLIIGLYFKS